MRKFRFIFLLVAVLLATGACTRVDDPQVNLDIFVRFPGQSQTKADTVEPDNIKETRIVDLRLWVFVHSSSDSSLNGHLLGFLAPTKLDYSGDAVNKFTIVLEEGIASKIQTVDVYVLANAKSAGLDMGNGLSPVNGPNYKKWSDLSTDELDGIMISGSAFGIKQTSNTDIWGPNNTGVYDTEGLPFSSVGKGLDISRSGSQLSVETVELVRAVSKVQFIFSQFEDSDGNKPAEFTIAGLKLNGGKLAKQEYIFPRKTTYDGGYLDNDLNFSVDAYTKANINGCLDPAAYECQVGESAQTYRGRINDGIDKGFLTAGPLCYLRESDKALDGVFSFHLAGESGNIEKNFSMADGETFSRNRSWIVYIYFMNDRMGISVRVLDDWENGGQYVYEAD